MVSKSNYSKAQAGLEYLVTYGWALILIATVISAAVFIINAPSEDTIFKSSNPTKIMIKGTTTTGAQATIKLQNITGGQIKKLAIQDTTGYKNCKIYVNENEVDNLTIITPGQELTIICTKIESEQVTIEMTYTDQAKLIQTVTISTSTTTQEPELEDGTKEHPFKITNCTELQAINDDPTAHYKLTNNINCGVAPYNQGEGFTPIGPTFTGSLDGQNHTISGLYINRPYNFVGLFEKTDLESEISNLKLASIDINGNGSVGGLVGRNEGTITNVSSSGKVTGDDWYIGGL